MTLDQVALTLPAGTVAVVLIAHGEDGSLVARYAEHGNAAPAPLRQVAGVLLQLAVDLSSTADELGDR